MEAGCTAKTGLHSVMNMLKNNRVDVVMGPSCSKGKSRIRSQQGGSYSRTCYDIS